MAAGVERVGVDRGRADILAVRESLNGHPVLLTISEYHLGETLGPIRASREGLIASYASIRFFPAKRMACIEGPYWYITGLRLSSISCNVRATG